MEPHALLCSRHALAALVALAAAAATVGWLGGAPPSIASGVSWGVPWPRGVVKKEQAFSLTTAGGKTLPVQRWPLTCWPDGSIKWSGFATIAGGDANGALSLSFAAGNTTASGATVRVRQTGTTIEVDTGALKTRIVKWGQGTIESMSIGGRDVARDGQLVCVVQGGPDGEAWEAAPRTQYIGRVEKVTIGQSGPVRAVGKLEGKHMAGQNHREWLPFVVRLYFYAGQE